VGIASFWAGIGGLTEFLLKKMVEAVRGSRWCCCTATTGSTRGRWSFLWGFLGFLGAVYLKTVGHLVGIASFWAGIGGLTEFLLRKMVEAVRGSRWCCCTAITGSTRGRWRFSGGFLGFLGAIYLKTVGHLVGIASFGREFESRVLQRFSAENSRVHRRLDESSVTVFISIFGVFVAFFFT
jgi:hypothetical protein